MRNKTKIWWPMLSTTYHISLWQHMAHNNGYVDVGKEFLFDVNFSGSLSLHESDCRNCTVFWFMRARRPQCVNFPNDTISMLKVYWKAKTTFPLANSHRPLDMRLGANTSFTSKKKKKEKEKKEANIRVDVHRGTSIRWKSLDLSNHWFPE